MSYMHSPVAWCDAAHTMVHTDQTQEQCAHEHACPPGRICPLGGRFANVHAANRGVQSVSYRRWQFSSAPEFLDL